MPATLKITRSGALLSGQAPQIVQQQLDALVTEVTMFLFAEVEKRTPQGVFGAQGGLLGSVQAEVPGKGTPTVKGAVFSGHQYVEVVEKGRTAGKGMPPAGSLLRWIEVKLGLPESEARRIEFVVRRKIGQKGFAGAHMFEKALLDNLNRLDSMAVARGLEIAKELA